MDASVIGERLARLAPWQRINHFPGMAHIARKNRLAQNLATMRRRFPVRLLRCIMLLRRWS